MLSTAVVTIYINEALSSLNKSLICWYLCPIHVRPPPPRSAHRSCATSKTMTESYGENTTVAWHANMVKTVHSSVNMVSGVWFIIQRLVWTVHRHSINVSSANGNTHTHTHTVLSSAIRCEAVCACVWALTRASVWLNDPLSSIQLISYSLPENYGDGFESNVPFRIRLYMVCTYVAQYDLNVCESVEHIRHRV